MRTGIFFWSSWYCILWLESWCYMPVIKKCFSTIHNAVSFYLKKKKKTVTLKHECASILKQDPNAEQQLDQTDDKSSHLSSFLTVLTVFLSIVLLLDKGDYPENLQIVCLCHVILFALQPYSVFPTGLFHSYEKTFQCCASFRIPIPHHFVLWCKNATTTLPSILWSQHPAQPKVPSQPRVLDWLNSNPLSRSCAQPGKVWTLSLSVLFHCLTLE